MGFFAPELDMLFGMYVMSPAPAAGVCRCTSSGERRSIRVEIGCCKRNSLILVRLRASEVCALGDPSRTFPPFRQINWLSAAPNTLCTELAHFARGVHLLLLDNILLLVKLIAGACSS